MVLELNQVNEHTLDSLPVAVILFNTKQVYFLNKKAIEIFKVPKNRLKEINKLSIFQFLDKKYHQRVRHNNTLILKGAVFPSTELEFKDFKNATVFIEASSNMVSFKGKKV